MPATGESWNQFKLLEPLGKGGMGQVFLAEDNTLQRNVALKFLPEPLRRNSTSRERFLLEARSAAALDHPYICKIYEIGEVEGNAFIAMEYVRGETLQDKLKGGPVPITELVDIGIETLEAVEAAHNKQIIHRDLKTANIMVTVDGHVKVMDFGLAKHVAMEPGKASDVDTMSARLTAHGSTPGTVVYMSPEQVRGEPLDARSDIFSIGVLLYELAAAEVPFQGATSGLTYDAILNRGAIPPRQHNPSVPAELEQIIEKALEKDREVRYQSVREMLVDLKRMRRDSDTGTHSFEALKIERAPRRSKSHLVGMGLAAVAIIAALAGWLFLRGAPAGSGVATQPIRSLAVLPFENSRNDPDVDYLSDGIAESLINQLSQLPQLAVKARSTAFRYRGRGVDPQAVGEELGVGAVLTGRVVQQGELLNVQAELVDTAQGTQLWGQQYERELEDLLTVQNELATEISDALRLELSGDEQSRLAAGGTANSEAYQAYLRGRYLWAKRTNADFKRAIGFFEQARDSDPDYALAYAGLADSYFLLGMRLYGPDPDFEPVQAVAQARASANEALRLDPSLPEPYATLGFIRFANDWDWKAAEADFQAAIERGPDYPTARQWYALYLSLIGQPDAAIEQARRAVSLEPLAPLSNRLLGIAYAQAERYPEAIVQLEKTLELAPNFPLAREFLMEVLWASGDTKRAAAVAEDYDADIGRVVRLAAEDRLPEARAALAEIPDTLTGGRRVHLHLIVGDADQFFEILEEQLERHDSQLAVGLASAIVSTLRDDPRMIQVRERIGIPR